MLTHYNVINNAWAAADHMGDSRTKTASAGRCRFTTASAPFCSYWAPLVSGAAMVVPAPMFHAAQNTGGREREQCTALYGVPTMFIAEMEEIDFDAFTLRSLRTGIMAGAPVDKELYEAVTQSHGRSRNDHCLRPHRSLARNPPNLDRGPR
jgi:fatty-acyl-CoA synthase